jgi:long-chain acyl-CoA synthetase
MDALLRTFFDLAAADPKRELVLGAERVWSRGAVARSVREAGAELARRLGAQGAGSVVALVVTPGPGFLVDFLACRAAGLCVLLLDYGLTRAERARIALELGASALVTTASGELERLAGTRQLPQAACLKLTSGSTGAPSAVVTPTASLLADGWALVRSMGLSLDDRIFAAVPMSHAYGLSILATPAWILGTPLVFADGLEDFEAAERLRATVFPTVPSWYDAQLAASERALPPSVRLWIAAGAPLRAATARAWRARHGCGVHAFYGSSECGGITFDRRGDAAERGSVGSALEGVRVELDSEGLVVVHSEAVTLGYLPPGGERDARLAPGVFRTEDLGRLEGGELWLAGRRSDWINVKGKKVDPREVEAVLAEHAAVRDVVVLGRALPEERGESVRAVIACEADALRFRDVVLWCRQRLAPHKWPRSVVFVRELPRTERGKLDRGALTRL